MTTIQSDVETSIPPPFNSSTLGDQSTKPVLLTQGAEALVFRTSFLTPSTPCALKYRPSKSYRHPILDKRLTRQRLLAEARVLVRCRKEGIKVPAVLAADWDAGWLALEWIPGWTIRKCLDTFLAPSTTDSPPDSTSTIPSSTDNETRAEQLQNLMRRIGLAIGHLHATSVVHGDLTTSNLMLRPPSAHSSPSAPYADASSHASASASASAQTLVLTPGPGPDESLPTSLAGTITLLDFGLAVQTTQDEDKAVDLYVLERAFTATHPAAEELFKGLLESYGTSYKGGKGVLKKLEEVRMRGRKRSMVG